ncbi:hypothetical protein B0H10DRAFT_2218517 [Mycena sp. CBHHK59/15]|nr:hypothetical protein B0H10DRAFT_2218517 [Mycena sp. CBHHK59/15]
MVIVALTGGATPPPNFRLGIWNSHEPLHFPTAALSLHELPYGPAQAPPYPLAFCSIIYSEYSPSPSADERKMSGMGAPSALFLLLTYLLVPAADYDARPDRTAEAGEAAITGASHLLVATHTVRVAPNANTTMPMPDPTVECTAYSYAPVLAAKANFPAIWEPVTAIPTTDATALAKFAAMNASIPNMRPLRLNIKLLIGPAGHDHGQLLQLHPTYSSSDLDCWWTYHRCVTPKLSGLSECARAPHPRYGFDDGPNCSHNAFYDYLT